MLFFFIKRNCSKFNRKNAAHVVCGNNYLANYFKIILKIFRYTNRYKFKNIQALKYNSRKKLICWSGTSGNFNYLYKIENEIKKVLDKETEWKLRIISDKNQIFI